MIDRERLVAGHRACRRSRSRASPATSRRWPSWMRRRRSSELGLARAVAAGRGRPRERARHPRPARAAGRALMFNGHMDTSYSGREPWLAGVPGFQPQAFVRGRPPLRPRHLEHEGRARLLRRGGARAAGRRRALRGRRADRRRLRRDREDAVRRRAGRASTAATRPGRATSSAHGGVADMCILGEPTERKVVLGHFGALWLRISHARQLHPHRLQRGQARPELDPAHARGARPRCSSGSRPGRTTRRTPTAARAAIVNVGAIEGGFGWRVSRTPHRTDLFLDVRVPPTKPMAVARRRCSTWCARSRGASPTTASRRGLRDRARRRDRRGPPARRRDRRRARGGVRRRARSGTSRAGSADASALTRYGVPTVNYGTSTGPAGHRARREPRRSTGWCRSAQVYARACAPAGSCG